MVVILKPAIMLRALSPRKLVSEIRLKVIRRPPAQASPRSRRKWSLGWPLNLMVAL
jgi:hypothetical protein